MSTLQISLPEHVKAVADEQVARGDYADHSEYVCHLIEADERRRGQAELETLLLARVQDERTIEMDEGDLQRMRDEFQRRIDRSKGS